MYDTEFCRTPCYGADNESIPESENSWSIHDAEAQTPKPVSTVTRCQGTARLECVNAVVKQNICAEGVALCWDRGAINAMQRDIFASVCRSKRNTEF